MAVSREQEFKVNLLVQIDIFGLPEVHRSNIIARVTREMQLMFGGRAHVTEASQDVRLPSTEVVEEEMHGVGEEPQVPAVQGGEASTGTRLGQVPDLVHGLRLPFPSKAPEGGTT